MEVALVVLAEVAPAWVIPRTVERKAMLVGLPARPKDFLAAAAAVVPAAVAAALFPAVEKALGLTVLAFFARRYRKRKPKRKKRRW